MRSRTKKFGNLSGGNNVPVVRVFFELHARCLFGSSRFQNYSCDWVRDCPVLESVSTDSIAANFYNTNIIPLIYPVISVANETLVGEYASTASL